MIGVAIAALLLGGSLRFLETLPRTRHARAAALDHSDCAENSLACAQWAEAHGWTEEIERNRRTARLHAGLARAWSSARWRPWAKLPPDPCDRDMPPDLLREVLRRHQVR